MSRAPGKSRRVDCEVCVLGGGPAGATLALRLATLGHEVCLVERSGASPQRAGETMSASFMALTDSLGMGDFVERAVICRIERPDVLWSAAQPRLPGPPMQVLDRGRFDESLRALAGRAGARLLRVARGSPRVERDRTGWRTEFETGDGRVRIAAKFLADARGRRARVGGRMRRASPATVAVSGRWRAVAHPLAGIEACECGWLWGLPLPRLDIGVTAFVDTARCAGLGRAALGALYRAMLARSKLFAGLCAGKLLAPLEVCDASALVHDNPAGDGWLRVGEASFAIDPLSSQGVQAAIGSSLQAGAIVHTMLDCADDAGMAMNFYRERQAKAAARHATWAARLYAEQDRVLRSSFWTVRSGAATLPAAAEHPPGPPALSLHSTIRRSPALALSARPVILGERVRMAAALDHPGLEEPFAYFGGVAVVPMLEDLPTDLPLGELLRRWQRHLPARSARALFLRLWHADVLTAATREGAHNAA